MLKLLWELARRITATLIALSLIIAVSFTAAVDHANAAASSCEEVSQTTGNSQIRALQGPIEGGDSVVGIKAGDLVGGGKGKDSGAIQASCCSLFCSPTAAMPPYTESLKRPTARAGWDLFSNSLSPAPQSGLKRPPRQSGNI